jgi:putative YphP/YqiW family bacilliredoxin
MREELTRLGIQETRTAQEVDAVLGEKKGTVLVVVNSVCGCAAGMARPAVAMALENDVRPEKMITVFAGNDRDIVGGASFDLPPLEHLHQIAIPEERNRRG